MPTNSFKIGDKVLVAKSRQHSDAAQGQEGTVTGFIEGYLEPMIQVDGIVYQPELNPSILAFYPDELVHIDCTPLEQVIYGLCKEDMKKS